MKPVVIVGAGFSGLSLAWELSRFKVPVKVIEKSKDVGGMLQTHRTIHGIAEASANGFLRTEKVEHFLSEIDVQVKKSQAESKRRYIFRDGIRRWPLSLAETLATLRHLAWSGLHGRGFFRPQPGESVQDWGLRCIGSSASRNILLVALQGIYGPNTQDLNAELVLNPLFDKKKSKTLGGLLTGEEGMNSIMKQLQSKLLDQGVEFHFEEDFTLEKVPENSAVVLCTQAFAAQKILQERCPKTSKSLSRIGFWSACSAKIFTEVETQECPPGFGILFPKSEKVHSLGVLFNAKIFAWPKNSETWILPSVGDATDCLNAVFRDRETLLKLKTPDVQDTVVDLWPQGLPLYDKNLQQVLNEIENSTELLQSKIYLHGNYLGAIGLSRILDRSQQLAEKIYQQLEKIGRIQ